MWPDRDTNFAQVAFVRELSHVYLFGIRHGRFGGVKLARVRADSQSPLDTHAYEYLREAGRDDWVADEVDAAEIIRGHVGELSVIWNDFLGRWIMMYVRPPSEGSHEAIMVREASSLTGQWSEPKEVCRGGYGSSWTPC